MRSDILISVIYTDDWQPIVDLTKPSLVEYCKRHGYHFTYNKYERRLKDFDKIRFLLDIMQQGYYDYIWQLDADAIITNHNIPIDKFIDDAHELFICKDINAINCGSFIIHQSTWGEWLLAWMLDLEGMEGKHCEQDALAEYMKCFPAQAERKIKFLEHPSINSYLCELYREYDHLKEKPSEQWSEGDFVLHLPGVDNSRRIEILKQINQWIIK